MGETWKSFLLALGTGVAAGLVVLGWMAIIDKLTGKRARK